MHFSFQVTIIKNLINPSKNLSIKTFMNKYLHIKNLSIEKDQFILKEPNLLFYPGEFHILIFISILILYLSFDFKKKLD